MKPTMLLIGLLPLMISFRNKQFGRSFVGVNTELILSFFLLWLNIVAIEEFDNGR